ncbi:hypothetical protein [Plebeiibacterium sediminum]|uniref:PKD domain-containing protein n=1 Tax=Plebeiibacterium sediminum TaxID=2992112 RepID=A0AAE3M7R6_9BACT|nr:hypothetical protein [Plebeiobacterium sediminum]MCW3788375.1 hypothetical protein [Plebeiobacterium sediminum]
MKNSILQLAMLLVVLCSCTRTEDYFSDYNQDPVLTINNDIDFVNDSVKINQNYYDAAYLIEDEEVNGILPTVLTDLRYEIQDENNIRFALDQTGSFPVTISYKDSWGKISKATFTLVVFENLGPIAKLNVSASDLNVTIDASDSYDQDEKYQGGIELYRFYVNRKEIDKTYHSSINYIFQEEGTYEIGVQVKDNDQEWSEIIYKTIEL